jgi:hypothetical protein
MKTINHSIHCPLTEEIKILEKLDNPHLIKLADQIFTIGKFPVKYCIITEYYEVCFKTLRYLIFMRIILKKIFKIYSF